jgi:hypothetical protein
MTRQVGVDCRPSPGDQGPALKTSVQQHGFSGDISTAIWLKLLGHLRKLVSVLSDDYNALANMNTIG